MRDHASALEYDLMTMTRYTLRDVGRALPWGALLHFVRHLPPTAELSKEWSSDAAEQAAWLDGSLVAPMLASLIDAINFGRWEYAASVSKHKPKRPKAVKTPWRDGGTEGRKLGSDPIPISEFEDWWNGRR